VTEIHNLRARVAALEQSAIHQLQWWRPFPFHGQRGRLAIWREVRELWRPEAVIETGTHVGNSAEFFAGSGLPFDTIEIDPTLYALASMRLRSGSNVTLHLGNSPAILRTLPASGLRTFFYLDAHWKDHLPVTEELEIIFARWPNHLVQIDDFEVPGDAGYGFDDYGPGKALRLELIAGLTGASNLYFPSDPSSADTGLVRGCILIASDNLLDQAATLRKHR